MAKVQLRAYTSPTLVLLALDWQDGQDRNDFLGFAIRRMPGFGGADSSWLPNRIGFTGPVLKGNPDLPSNEAPIQKFMWWDARIDEGSAGNTYTYAAFPVCGSPARPTLIGEAAADIDVVIPRHVENGIGTWFNRAVVSSQAFSRIVADLGITFADPQGTIDDDKALLLRKWLANGMEKSFANFLAADGPGDEIAGAIYHLTDFLWVVPALEKFSERSDTSIELVYDAKKLKNKAGKVLPNPNQKAIDELDYVVFKKRDKTNIMHDKFLVRGRKLSQNSSLPQALLCGSANFTTEGLTSQANLVHTFAAPDLAAEFLDREKLIRTNPTKANTAKNAKWSYMHTVGSAGVRVYFSPEKTDQRESIDTVVRAIHQARSSVLFCLFMPTDAPLREACFAAGDNGKMMFGLVNNIANKEGQEVDEDMHADEVAAIELYHRSQDKRDVVSAKNYRWDNRPAGFDSEWQLFPGEKSPPFPPVIIHHKFIIIDAETANPVIFSGSANMSKNSVNHNDENLLEIRGSKPLAATYLAEFMRLYEHYRARAAWLQFVSGHQQTYKLARDASWCGKHYSPGSPEFRARLAMVQS